jgi:ABC-type uncharacterized transport system ATPase subunit
MLGDVSATFALAEQMEVAFAGAVRETEAVVRDGDVTVLVNRDGPLRTTLITSRTGLVGTAR